ncbi:MAG TPA: hypothetical protein VGB73_11010 [Pyrinomonadaceae bacterium]|jgi:hypothetical protein
MTTKSSVSKLTRAEQETRTGAERLYAQIADALAALTIRSSANIEDLELCADRLERAARDLAVCLRELAYERSQMSKEESSRLVAVGSLQADKFFNAAQQERLAELMKLRQAGNLSTELESELESLIAEELDGARRRAGALLDVLKP